ncbi:uncharacterized protein VTP21DRAFT_9273 [Calcarisporiella thermophila]|uniref:uncharacterized protein n=1 Tax=Calcarisporiella thermophila TaxID=911321 RepID=UPI0037446B39
MIVFVLGATGFVGAFVAKKFRQHGHTVYGLCRSEKNAASLSRDEIIPIVGSAETPETWRSIASIAHVIVDASANWDDPVQHCRAVLREIEEIGKQRPAGLVYIFTSGVWIYGHRPGETIDEWSAPKPPRHVAWREEVEKEVLRSTSIHPIVIRPSMIYGGSGSCFASFFEDASKGRPITVFGDETTRWSTIHGDDMAEAYVLVAEQAALLSRQIFVLGTCGENVADMARAAGRAAGRDNAEIKFTKPTTSYDECLALTCPTSSRKAERVLGWRPKHVGFVEEVDSLYASWKGFHL